MSFIPKPYGTIRTTNVVFQKSTEFEAYLLDETKVRGRLAKKRKQFNTVKNMLDAGPIASIVTTRGVSIAVYASAAGLLVGIALSRTSLEVELKSFENIYYKARK